MENKLSYQENAVVQRHRWLILVAIGLFTFMSTLDGSIVNIALITIASDMQVPINQAQWIVSVYLMTVCACLLVFGKIGDSIGKIKVFKMGTIVFVVGSLLCGIADSLWLILLARCIQAVGGSMTMSTNSGIITEIFPFKERGRALGMIGSFVSLGSIAGPGLGGIILAKFSWHYIFLINVPVGLLTMLLGWYCLPKDLLKTGKKIDYAGFTAFASFIMLLFGGIFLGQEVGFAQMQILLLFALSVCALVAFILIERKKRDPLIVFAMFRNRMFTVSLVTACMIFASNFFMNVLNPIYLLKTKGISASEAGFYMMVFPFAMIIAAPISGAISDKIGPRKLTFIGLGILGLSQFCFLFLDGQSPILFFTMATALTGLGNAVFQSPNNTIIMSSVSKEYLGLAGSMNALARNFGMVVGIATSTTVLYQSMSSAYGQKITTYIDGRPDVFITGMHTTFCVSFVICLLALLLTIWVTASTKNKKELG